MPGSRPTYRDPEEAIRRAERAVAADPVAGTYVVRVLADEVAGDLAEPGDLAAFGTVPDPG